jgi:methionyl-tRNA synthetase
MSKFYITTAIDYINGKPHLGHVYEKTGADVAARYRKLRGDEVFLLLGTDEHSLNVLKTATDQGLAPQDFCDRMVGYFQDLYRGLQIDYDRFIRTTDGDHLIVVGFVVERLREKGYITRGTYAGKYCSSCEAFLDESELVEGRCRYHPGQELTWVEEENYFFALSRFQEPLKGLYQEQPEFLEPETWRNEVINRLESGLKDISISRASVEWGIPFPQNPDHVVYVWFDALLNYLTGAGFYLNEALYGEAWPADLQIVGKDITWFHGVIWPAILLALEVPLPKQIFAHGHLLHRGQKLSKSAGIVIDPVRLLEGFGADVVRYYLMKAIPWGADGNFSYEGLATVYNNDLANDYGNLLSRTTAMVYKYFEGWIPKPGKETEVDKELREAARVVIDEYCRAMEWFEYTGALETVLKVVGMANRYIESTAPWELAKEESNKSRLGTVLYQLVEVIRIGTVLFSPFMPSVQGRVWEQLGLSDGNGEEAGRLEWGYEYEGIKIKRGAPLFPRLEVEKLVAEYGG